MIDRQEAPTGTKEIQMKKKIESNVTLQLQLLLPDLVLVAIL